ncbi:hypothetical protein CHLRE_03g172600v5 [Chlamydomonas reinhardtii]|uniref:RING-type domain-containing protein n=1 Tax=Chlamydomonas reinhardtii TaxID=3055 RepID=A0A2K3DX71_CHLRE|nr:uncharacterized protein CHLRE_03g172600v5 [Chlamydomonas reinhardtii]PNW85121.1 hypothetical protein CHLRE_03g172600v5 [Chlamydomonas reinhardtii]
MSCPLGFGGPASKSSLTPYHCILCRGLLHEPITTPCRHVFCAFCIRPFRDCPVCAADLDGNNTPDAALAGTINKLLTGHVKLLAKATGAAGPPVGSPVPASSSCPAAAGAAAPAPPPASCPASTSTSAPTSADPGAPGLDLPSLLLQLALQSLAGGNPEAALARLDMCADTLCSAAEAAAAAAAATGSAGAGTAVGTAEAKEVGPKAGTASTEGASTAGAGPDALASAGAGWEHDPVLRRRVAAARTSADAASRLGAVLGSAADCHRRLGDAPAALSLYAASAACLAPWRSGGEAASAARTAAATASSREAEAALGVTHNKLGDLLMLLGRLREARAQYLEALGLRRAALARALEAGAEADGAEAGAAGEGSGGKSGTSAGASRLPAEELVQDVCDLATSCCKVADVNMALREAEAAVGSQPEAAAAGSGSGAEPGAGLGASASEGGVGSDVDAEAGLASAAALLAEARAAMLRPNLAPYAAAVQAAAAKAAAAAAAAATGGSAAEGGARGGREAAPAATAAAPLPAQLVGRYGRVWGALEQLTARLAGLGVGTGPQAETAK